MNVLCRQKEAMFHLFWPQEKINPTDGAGKRPAFSRAEVGGRQGLSAKGVDELHGLKETVSKLSEAVATQTSTTVKTH